MFSAMMPAAIPAIAVDYGFGLTAAKTLSVDASGITQLDLEYGSEAQVYNQHPDGSFSSTPDMKVSTWNRVTNVSGFNGQPVAAPLTLPSSGVSSETGDSSLHYYVRFTLNNGTALTVDANKLFALDSFSLGDEQTLNIGSQSSGAGAGKVTFDPLHLSFLAAWARPHAVQDAGLGPDVQGGRCSRL